MQKVLHTLSHFTGVSTMATSSRKTLIFAAFCGVMIIPAFVLASAVSMILTTVHHFGMLLLTVVFTLLFAMGLMCMLKKGWNV